MYIMKGSVKKEGSSWYYVVDLGKDEFGKRKRKKQRGFKTKKEAEQALAKVVNEVNNGTYVEPTKTLYSDFLNEWLENKRNSIKKQTYENYILLSNIHIIPSLGSLTVSQLTPMVIQRFINDLLNKGLSASYVKKILAILTGSLKKAEQWGMIHKNPTSLIEKPRLTKKEMLVWDEKEIEQFLKVAQADRLYIAFLLAITTGMRQGEILGLRWKDIDFESGILYIRQTLSHDGKIFLSEAKTKSSLRSIHLPNESIEALKKHRRMVIQEKLKAEHYTDLDLVVCTVHGTQVNASNLNRTFKRLQEEAKVTKIRFHDLRHTHATLLIKLGINPKVVAERLGHSNTRMTLDTYSHVLPNMQEEAVQKLNVMFSKERISV